MKIYYDGGQQVVSKALSESFERVLSRGAVMFRLAGAIERTSTDEKIFGGVGACKRNYLK